MFPLTDGMRPRRFPIVTGAIILANFLVWIFYQLPSLDSSIAESSFYVCDVNGSCDSDLPWVISWFTAMFMHASWEHLLGNMWFLAIFGKNVEDAFGRIRFLALYVAGGFAATALQTALTLGEGTPADARAALVGASGALAAVLGAYWLFYPKAKVLTLVLIFPIRIPAWLFLGGWFVYQLVNGHADLVTASEHAGGTAFFAHIGGFVLGVAAAGLLVSSDRGAERLSAKERAAHA